MKDGMLKETEQARIARAIYVARAKQLRTVKFRLRCQLLVLNLTELQLEGRLIMRRAIRKTFLYLKLGYHKSMVLLMDGLLLLNHLYEKFSTHFDSKRMIR
jgi:hypothetical protein